MTTLAEMRTMVARMLRDPSGKVFSTADLTDMVNTGLTEIGRLAPTRFQEDIDPVENQFAYTLQSGVFSAAVSEIEVSRVELWDVTTTPHSPRMLVQPHSQGYINFSAVGWAVREGVLEVPYSLVRFIGSSTDNFILRVWGYAPYPAVSADADVITVSGEKAEALKAYCRYEALQRLVHERDLFTQWQTHAGNTDVSPASLLSGLDRAENRWKVLSRSITVLREAAG